jgi:hypothetical protein
MAVAVAVLVIAEMALVAALAAVVLDVLQRLVVLQQQGREVLAVVLLVRLATTMAVVVAAHLPLERLGQIAQQRAVPEPHHQSRVHR